MSGAATMASGWAASAARPLAARLGAELAPHPGRLREALIVALAPTIAILISVTVQLGGFAGALMAFMGVQQTVVSSWHNLLPRLAVIAVSALLVVPFGGFLMQQPWFLLPAFLLVLSGTLYFLPMARRPLEGSAMLLLVVVTVYVGLFAPGAIASTARDVACEAAIGVLVATVLSELFPPAAGPRSRLAMALASSFRRNRERLRTAIERYRAAEHQPLPPEAPAYSNLSAHLQLLDLVRQVGLEPGEERLLVGLTTTAERIESFVGTLDSLARQDVGRTYRRLLDGALVPLVEALDQALAGFEATARGIDLGSSGAADLTSAEAPWPDLLGLVRALEDRQLELRRAGSLAAITLSESTNTNACIRALAGAGLALHSSPAELGRLIQGGPGDQPAAPRGWPTLPRLDRFAARYALHGGLGATICLVVGLAAHAPALSTGVWYPMLLAQSSYGATLRRAGLMMLGVVTGCLLGVASIIAFMPNATDVTLYLVLCFTVAAAGQYMALGRKPANWCFGYQVVSSFLIVVFGLAPSADVFTALWRVWGALLGTAILFTVYRVIAPDYAGRQLVARFHDLLRAALDFLPEPGAPPRPLAQLVETRLEIGRAVADLLRLADEARFEGRQGVDADAAVHATGLAMRLAYRSGLIARGRTTAPLPALAEPVAVLLAELETAASARVAIDLRMVEARNTRARPGAAAHRRAVDRALVELALPRPDVAAAVSALGEHIESTRFAPLASLPPGSAGELLAALEHYRRIAELLPRLEDALARALLPGRHGEPTGEGDPHGPARGPDDAPERAAELAA